MDYGIVDHLWSLGAAAAGGSCLWAVYRHIQSRWPLSYYSMTDNESYIKSAAPSRYLLFRFGPIVVISAFGVRQLASFDRPLWTFCIALWIIHTASTTGRALMDLYRSHTKKTRRGPLLILHYVSIMTSLFCTSIPIPLSDSLSVAIPDLEQVVASLWTALFVIIVGILFVHVSRKNIYTLDEIVERQHSKIGRETLVYAESKALEAGLDWDLVRAVMLAESLQRPLWFRKLERLKGQIWRKGTYGIMQVESARPISDRESIDRAVEVHRYTFAIDQDQEEDLSFWELKDRIEAYNPSSPFFDMVREIYHHYSSSRRSPDR